MPRRKFGNTARLDAPAVCGDVLLVRLLGVPKSLLDRRLIASLADMSSEETFETSSLIELPRSRMGTPLDRIRPCRAPPLYDLGCGIGRWGAGAGAWGGITGAPQASVHPVFAECTCCGLKGIYQP
jgi:hypothetical protein